MDSVIAPIIFAKIDWLIYIVCGLNVKINIYCIKPYYRFVIDK